MEEVLGDEERACVVKKLAGLVAKGLVGLRCKRRLSVDDCGEAELLLEGLVGAVYVHRASSHYHVTTTLPTEKDKQMTFRSLSAAAGHIVQHLAHTTGPRRRPRPTCGSPNNTDGHGSGSDDDELLAAARGLLDMSMSHSPQSLVKPKRRVREENQMHQQQHLVERPIAILRPQQCGAREMRENVKGVDDDNHEFRSELERVMDGDARIGVCRVSGAHLHAGIPKGALPTTDPGAMVVMRAKDFEADVENYRRVFSIATASVRRMLANAQALRARVTEVERSLAAKDAEVTLLRMQLSAAHCYGAAVTSGYNALKMTGDSIFSQLLAGGGGPLNPNAARQAQQASVAIQLALERGNTE
jgi:hypothetical protein